MSRKRRRVRLTLTVLFTLIVFCILTITMVMVGAITVAMRYMGLFSHLSVPNMSFLLAIVAIAYPVLSKKCHGMDYLAGRIHPVERRVGQHDAAANDGMAKAIAQAVQRLIQPLGPLVPFRFPQKIHLNRRFLPG